jgi:hypothetical protein
MGLLRPSFVPPPEVRALRSLARARQQVTRDRAREWQRMEKVLLRHEALLSSDGGGRPPLSRRRSGGVKLEAA